MEKGLSDQIRQKALGLGYINCAIIPAEPFMEFKTYLDERIALFPASQPAYSKLYRNVAPPSHSRSIVLVIRDYGKYRVPAGLDRYYGKVYLAEGRAYFSPEYRMSLELGEFLKLHGMHVIPTAIPTRWAAQRARLGFFGYNNFFYTDHGSYIHIDYWVVDKELEYDGPAIDQSSVKKLCNERCGKCVRACPTGALSGEYCMDIKLCVQQLISYTRELPSDDLKEKLGTWIYGCDACQDACPMNIGKREDAHEFPLLMEMAPFITPDKVLEMSEDHYRNFFQPMFWYISPNELWRWKSHALRAMVNSGDPAFHPLIRQRVEDPDDRIRATALWGCAKLGL